MACVVEALNVLLQGLPGLLLDAAHVAHGRRPVASTWKLAMKRVRIWSQEEIVPGARFRSQVRAPSFSAIGNQLAMTFSSPLAASMINS